jgi:hypothetical protein
VQEPILRLLNLQLQRQRRSRLDRFFQIRIKYFCFKRTRLLVALSYHMYVGLVQGVCSLAEQGLGISFCKLKLLTSAL